MRKKIILIIAGLLIAGLLIFKFTHTTAKKENTASVKRQTLKETLSVSGKVAASEDVTLRFATSGRLVWVGVKQGDYVKKYQSIASLDSREVQDNLKKYLNTYMSTRWDFEQQKDNYKNQSLNDAMQRILDKSQFDLNNSVIDVELKNLAVEYANLWTPIEGMVVSADSPQAGVNITPTQAEFEIINPKSIYFSATADQSDVVKLTASQSAVITLDAYPDKQLNSTITNVSFVPKTGETGTVYEVKMTLNQDESYRLGMTGDATFTIREKPGVLSLPSKFIKSDGSGKFVFMKVNNSKMKKTITTGDTFDNDIEITSGLSDGDVVYENQ